MMRQKTASNPPIISTTTKIHYVQLVIMLCAYFMVGFQNLIAFSSMNLIYEKLKNIRTDNIDPGEGVPVPGFPWKKMEMMVAA